MPPFPFRFQTLLNYRNRIVEERELALARQLAILQQLQRQLQTLITERERTTCQLAAALKGPLQVGVLELDYRYLNHLERRIEAQREQIRGCEKELDRLRQALTSALQDRKTLEKLREYHLAAFQAEMNRREAQTIDDLNVTRHRRR